MEKHSSSKTRAIAITLGLTAGLLGWVAALITYIKSGEVKLGLIAAGLFFAALPFSMKSGSKEQK